MVAHNYISLAAGASLWGAALSQAGVTLDSARVILGRDGISSTYTFSQSPTQSQTASASATPSQSLTTGIYYVTPVDMLSVKTFALLAASDISNTVRVPWSAATEGESPPPP